MQKNKTSKTIVVHNGEFHADDVFAVAALKLYLGDDYAVELVRSRDESVLSEADFVVDVGRTYDAAKGRFDHHQPGGAGERENGVPYASFGLVWKTYGIDLSGSDDAAKIIDQRLVQPIDALDNGVQISKEIIPNLRPYDVSSVVGIMNQICEDSTEECLFEVFLEAVDWAKRILSLEITNARYLIDSKDIFIRAYERSEDKRIIVLDQDCAWESIVVDFVEPLYVVYPKGSDWRVKAVRVGINTFENRKNLPLAWAGKSDDELTKATGVPGGIFCHNKLFLAAAQTREGAIKMAEIAANS